MSSSKNIADQINVIKPLFNDQYPGLKRLDKVWFFVTRHKVTGEILLRNIATEDAKLIVLAQRHLLREHEIIHEGFLNLKDDGPYKKELFMGNEHMVTYGLNTVSIIPTKIKFNRYFLDFVYDYAMENIKG